MYPVHTAFLAAERSLHQFPLSVLPSSHGSTYNCTWSEHNALAYATACAYHAIADPSTSQILGTAALLVERKFIRSCGKVREELTDSMK